MNSAIELHDSWIESIIQAELSVVIYFRPAYVHRSQGRPGFEAGSGWTQDFDFIVYSARIESSFSEFPQELHGGELAVDRQTFEHLIPLPVNMVGQVRFSVFSIMGNQPALTVTGSGVEVIPVSTAHFVEEFPGCK
jgi:hypothetical protein